MRERDQNGFSPLRQTFLFRFVFLRLLSVPPHASSFLCFGVLDELRYKLVDDPFYFAKSFVNGYSILSFGPPNTCPCDPPAEMIAILIFRFHGANPTPPPFSTMATGA